MSGRLSMEAISNSSLKVHFLSNILQLYVVQAHFVVVGNVHCTGSNQYLKGVRFVVSRLDGSFPKARRPQSQLIHAFGALRTKAIVLPKPLDHLGQGSFHQIGLNSQGRQEKKEHDDQSWKQALGVFH